jgi:Mrp family chromosome partitioning ATPase
MADFVIIDSPPVLAVADASVLAPLADGVIIVSDPTRSSRGALLQAKAQLENVGASVVGGVYNNVDPNQATAYPYSYSYADRSGFRRRSRRPLAGIRLRPSEDSLNGFASVPLAVSRRSALSPSKLFGDREPSQAAGDADEAAPARSQG